MCSWCEVELLVNRKGKEISMWGTKIQTPLKCKSLHDVKVLVLGRGGMGIGDPRFFWTESLGIKS